MGFNGSGTFVRLYRWQADSANGINITDSRMDAEMDGFATGLSNCITRDGQSPPVAPINWGNQPLINVASLSAATGAFTGTLTAASATISGAVNAAAAFKAGTAAGSGYVTLNAGGPTGSGQIQFFGAGGGRVGYIYVPESGGSHPGAVSFGSEGPNPGFYFTGGNVWVDAGVNAAGAAAFGSTVTADQFISSRISGNIYKVGNDAWIADVDKTDAMGIVGQANGNQGFLYFGTGTAATYGLGCYSGDNRLYFGANPVWNRGYQGSGTGMDADTVDGLHASAFALASAFTSGSNANGYWRKLPDGTIEQWGNNPTVAGEGAITQAFPIAFTDLNSIAVDITIKSNRNTSNDMWAQLGTVTLNSFECWYAAQTGGNTGYGFSWRAIGR